LLLSPPHSNVSHDEFQTIIYASTEDDMGDMREVIESSEIRVSCWQCEWADYRTIGWLGARRDMNCPACSSVIVLDTSKVRAAIAHQRQQLAALHGQMTQLLEGATKIARSAQVPAKTSKPTRPQDLALARMHPDASEASSRSAVATRRFSR
jgi:hypothetical protein